MKQGWGEGRAGTGGKSVLLCLLPGQASHLWVDGTLSCAQCLLDDSGCNGKIFVYLDVSRHTSRCSCESIS